jgi:hypothetical protein
MMGATARAGADEITPSVASLPAPPAPPVMALEASNGVRG